MENKGNDKGNPKKKIVIISIIILVIFGIFIGLKMMVDSNNKEKVEKLTGYEDKNPNDLHQSTLDLVDNPVYDRTVSFSKIDEKVSENEESFVYLYSPECVHCKAFTPELTDYLNKEKIKNVYYINVLEYPEAFTKYNAMYTPTMLKVSNENFEKTRFEGAVPMEDLKKFFKNAERN